MSVKAADLYELARDMNVRLLAGEKGLSNKVRWYHMVESVEIAAFLGGGEIVFTTGVGLKNEDELFSLLKAVVENGASAMVVNTGRYIKSVPDSLIAFAREREFPIFECPWETHMADIMKRLSLRIAEEERTNAEVTAALTALFTSPAQAASCAHLLELHGYRRNEVCCCSLSVFEDENGEKLYPERELAEALEPFEADSEIRLISCNFFGRLLSVTIGKSDSALEELLQKIHDSIKLSLPKGVFIKGAAGKAVSSLDELGRSYAQAERVISTGNVLLHKGELSFYSRTGVYQLLLAIDDDNILRGYCEETLGKLRRGEKSTKTELCDSVKTYIKCDGSLKAAADELGIHKNTVLNKLRRAEQLLGIDLSAADARCALELAFKAEEVLKSRI